MNDATSLLEPASDAAVIWEVDPPAPSTAPATRRRPWLARAVAAVAWSIARATEWVFGVVCLILGLSILAALPILQFLSLGYFMESSARVARSGRLRDGLIGVRRAARVGGVIAGGWVSLVPLWLADSVARSAELIEPGGPTAQAWRVGVVTITTLTFLHILIACARGGRWRHFLTPMYHPFWVLRRLRAGGLYRDARDQFCAFVVSLRLPYYFRLGLVGFLGTLVWIAVPATLIALGGRAPVVGVVGAILLAIVAPWLPFLQVRYAVEGRARALFSLRAARDRFRRAPWAFAFALLVMLLAAVPLYLLKIEMVPREAAWLPSLVFVVFLAPARLLIGWAYSRSGRRERPRHWFFRVVGRLAILPAALLYVLVVFLSQYTSWGGVASLYEQHAFLLPVPFLSM